MLGSGVLVLGGEEPSSTENEKPSNEPPPGFEAEVRDAFPGLKFETAQIRALFRAIKCCHGEMPDDEYSDEE